MENAISENDFKLGANQHNVGVYKTELCSE